MTTYTLTQQTTISVQLIIRDDTGTLAFFILWATRLLSLLWQVGYKITVVKHEFEMLRRDVASALDFTWKVGCICVQSLLFGMGIRL